MKSKGLFKVFISAFITVLFGFGVKVSAEGFEPSFVSGINNVEVVQMNSFYGGPEPEDVSCFNEGTCSVVVEHEINIRVSKSYVVTYTVTDNATSEVKVLTRSVFVANTNPLLSGSSDIYPEGSTANDNFNFTIDGNGTSSKAEDAGVNLFIGHEVKVETFSAQSS